jgi:anti-anti-sigma factor
VASPVKIVSDLWEAYEQGGVDAVLRLAGDDAVWQPDPASREVLRTPDELRAYAEQAECPLELVEIEQHGQAVLCGVTLGGRELHWVAHVRLGRFSRLASFASREDALGSLVALQAVAGPVFGVREEAGTVTVRGELDVATAGSLEKLLLRRREPGTRIRLDLSGLGFMDSTGLRVLLRAQQAAERGGWEVELVGVTRPVRRLFDLSGVHDALPPVVN